MEYNNSLILHTEESRGSLENDGTEIQAGVLLKVTRVTKRKVKNNMRTKKWRELEFQGAQQIIPKIDK